ncbi:hypothetical protein RHSIM_Rhsim07G0045300 [Rhododendron simsii]|uniref:Uncharacterized protein n=1 Tax=Rhododendron simsii TaxID=118357 RepID=A0A834GTC7_RHOSS|nr:hypothetical protein RHSIM_Rhsim07G0045300 [Rhododendron simsii]
MTETSDIYGLRMRATSAIYIPNEAHKLVQHMKSHEPPKRWDILASIWAEMLCHAAWRTLRMSSSNLSTESDDLAKRAIEKECDCSCFGSTTN